MKLEVGEIASHTIMTKRPSANGPTLEQSTHYYYYHWNM